MSVLTPDPPAEEVVFSPRSALTGNPPVAGTADVWCVGPADLARVSETGALLACNVDDQGRHRLAGVTIVTPRSSGGDNDAELTVLLDAACAGLDDTVATEVRAAFVRARFEHIVAETLDTDDLLKAIAARTPGRRAVLVHHAADFRNHRLEIKDETRAWAEQLAETARRVCAAVLDTEAWVMLDAGIEAPTDPLTLAVLFDIGDKCGVVTTRVDGANPFSDDPVAHSRRWREQIERGDIGSVVAELNAAPLSANQRAGIKIQLLSEAGLKPQVVELLREQKAADKPADAEVALAYARAAERVLDYGLAEHFMRRAAEGLRTLEALEGGLTLCCRLNDEDTADALAERLKQNYPASSRWLDYQAARAREAGDYAAAADLLRARPERSGEAAIHAWLAAALAEASPDYDALEAFATASWPSELRMVRTALARHAQKHGAHVDAVALLLPTNNHTPSSVEVRTLIHAMSALMLHQGAADEGTQFQLLMTVTETALRHLGRRPTDADVRRGVDQLLSTERSGRLGRIVALALLDQLSDAAVAIPDKAAPRPEVTKANVDNLEAAAGTWQQSQGVLALGRSVCPTSLLPADFHAGTVWALYAGLETREPDLASTAEIDALVHAAALIVGFAAHLTGNDRTLDIQTVKIVAGRLARTQNHQRARDMIEVALDMAGDDASRRRAAWFAYGETYRLTGDLLEAARAFAIASSIDVALTLEEAWGETLDLLRLMRDLDRSKKAAVFITRAEAILARGGLSQGDAHRLETLRLQIEQRRVLQSRPLDPSAVAALVTAAAVNARDIVAAGQDLGPITAVLAQTIRLADTLGLETAAEIRTECETYLERLPSTLAGQLRRFSVPAPEVEDLIDLARELSGARFARDMALDVSTLVMLARRFLGREDIVETSAAALYALELLADQGVPVRDIEGDEAPTVLADDPEALVAIAADISRDGMDLLFVGLDDKERLVRTLVRDGKATPPVVEPDSVFSMDALAVWRRTFPYEYGFLRDRPGSMAANLSRFHTSLEKIGIGSLKGQRTLIIPDAGLADLPMNLLPIGGEFAGLSRTIATAPSLSWLSRARAWRIQARGASQCWISTALDADGGSTLRDMAERLEPDLTASGITLSTQETPPATLVDAELAIIGAHGGLARSENKYFRAVADEGRLVMSPTALANAVAGARIVILFVCSGGRLDMEPDAQAAMGLARKLLDRGCSAVVGSPWPMSASIPPHWLKTFLQAWSIGLPVADAAFHANAAVAKTLGDTPDLRLAMHVYGDPLVTKI